MATDTHRFPMLSKEAKVTDTQWELSAGALPAIIELRLDLFVALDCYHSDSGT